MGWAEWWLIGLGAVLLWRCIYELLHLDSERVAPWGLGLVGAMGCVVVFCLTLAAVAKVFG